MFCSRSWSFGWAIFRFGSDQIRIGCGLLSEWTAFIRIQLQGCILAPEKNEKKTRSLKFVLKVCASRLGNVFKVIKVNFVSDPKIWILLTMSRPQNRYDPIQNRIVPDSLTFYYSQFPGDPSQEKITACREDTCGPPCARTHALLWTHWLYV